jgi:hypothetical protein
MPSINYSKAKKVVAQARDSVEYSVFSRAEIPPQVPVLIPVNYLSKLGGIKAHKLANAA